jgi:DNA-binding transcriptional ArsR family regulator
MSSARAAAWATWVDAAYGPSGMVPMSSRTKRFPMRERDNLSATFAALADPTRRAIIARLLDGEASVAELAEPFRITPRAVSKHVAVLEAAGLVTRGRAAQRRPTRIEMEPLVAVETWVHACRQGWLDRFDHLDEHLARQRRPDKRARNANTR